MWVECISDRVYRSREHLAEDIVRVLREELHSPAGRRRGARAARRAGALRGRLHRQQEHAQLHVRRAQREGRGRARSWPSPRSLLGRVVAGLPRERLALHVCRGNWTRDERAALAGDYRPLLPLLAAVPVGTLFLELATPRAGEMDVLASCRPTFASAWASSTRSRSAVETVDEIAARARRAVALFGAERVLLTPDCGFATFADTPIASAAVAEAKLRALVEAAELVRRG